MDNVNIYGVVIAVIIIIIGYFYFKYSKRLVCECVTLINGGVKTGKSTLSVHLTLKFYRRALIRYYIRKYLFRKKEEKPLLYSNIPLKCDHVLVTKEVLERTKRVPYGSCMYLGEFSLVADNKVYENTLLNEKLMLFIKLFGHETGGKGKLFIDTQAIGDLPVVVRRCLSRYIYIERSIKWIPFVIVMYVRELFYSEDGSTVNTYDSDIEDNNKFIIISKRVWKKFDYTCYSVFTDDLNCSNKIINGKELTNLKAHKITSFKTYATIPVICEDKQENEVVNDSNIEVNINESEVITNGK